MKKIILLLIGLLGFATACEKDDDENEGNGKPTLLYGVPSAKYQEKSQAETELALIILEEEGTSNEQ
jgi:hypothetical protein